MFLSFGYKVRLVLGTFVGALWLLPSVTVLKKYIDFEKFFCIAYRELFNLISFIIFLIVHFFNCTFFLCVILGWFSLYMVLYFSLIYSLNNVFEQNKIYLFQKRFIDKIICDIFTARDTKSMQTQKQTHTYIYVIVCVYVYMRSVRVNMRFVSLVVKE